MGRRGNWWIASALALVFMAGTLAACGGKKEGPYTYRREVAAVDKPRELFYTVTEQVPPRDNYLRDVFDSAQAISYLRAKVREAISRKGFTPLDYDLVASKQKFNPDSMFLEVKATIKFKGSDPEYIVKTSTSLRLREKRDGKTVFSGGDSVTKSATRNYSAAMHKSIDEALQDMNQIPRYTGY